MTDYCSLSINALNSQIADLTSIPSHICVLIYKYRGIKTPTRFPTSFLRAGPLSFENGQSTLMCDQSACLTEVSLSVQTEQAQHLSHGSGPLPVLCTRSDETAVFTVSHGNLRGSEQRWTLGTVRVMWTMKYRAPGQLPLQEAHKQELLFIISIIPFFFLFQKFTFRFIMLVHWRKKKTGITTKWAGGEGKLLFINFIMSQLRLISPSRPSLYPPCYEAIMWIFMKFDPYQQENKRAAHSQSPARLLHHVSVAPSILSSFAHVLLLLLSSICQITRPHALPPSASQLHIFWMALNQPMNSC